MTEWRVFVTGSIAAFALGIFLGIPIGLLQQKWATQAEATKLREHAAQAAHDGKVCCDAAYVAIKYRPECGQASK